LKGVKSTGDKFIALEVMDLLCEFAQREQLNIGGVVKSLPTKKEISFKGFDKASKHKKKNSKVNKIDYGFGFIDGAEWMKEILNK